MLQELAAIMMPSNYTHHHYNSTKWKKKIVIYKFILFKKVYTSVLIFNINIIAI